MDISVRVNGIGHLRSINPVSAADHASRALVSGSRYVSTSVRHPATLFIGGGTYSNAVLRLIWFFDGIYY